MNTEEKHITYILSPPTRETRHFQSNEALLHSNILVARVVANIIKSTYGPRGMDKLIRDADGNITVSNDGATILKLLPVRHPIAHIIIDTCLSHDKEVGDGTTGVVLLTSALLDCAAQLLQHVLLQDIIRGYQEGLEIIMEEIEKIGKESNFDSLRHVAATSLNSKMLNPHSSFFVDLLSKVLKIVPKLEMNKIRIEKITGADLRVSEVMEGIIFEPTFSYAGADQLSKSLLHPKILFLDHEIEHKHQKEYAQAVIDDPVDYNDFIKAEWDLVYEKLEKIVSTDCNIVLNVQATGDVATQYFAERGIVCISRIDLATLQLLSSSTHSSIQRSLQFLASSSSSSSSSSTSSSSPAEFLGKCEKYELKTIGVKKYHVFTGCEGVASFILRGGSNSVLAEAERSIIDAIHAMRAVLGQSKIVPGGGATECHLASHIRKIANNCESGKRKMVLNGMAEGFEVLPRTLADNCGFDASKLLAELSHIHYNAVIPNFESYGINIRSGSVCDAFSLGVVEGIQAKSKAISAAIDSACMILFVDRIVVH